DRDFAVAHAELAAVAAAFNGPQLEDILIELREIGRLRRSNRDMMEMARLLPAFFDVAFAYLRDALLRHVHVRARGVLDAHDGERHVLEAARDAHLGIFF